MTIEFIEAGDIETANGAVIWLHGLGADGHDFEAIVPELQLPVECKLRFVFPHAPVRPVTINGGVAMRAWFDIVSLDRNGPVDAAGIKDSARLLQGLIDREQQRGIEHDRIVVAGFSQGGAIAAYTAIACPQRLAGLMALSTYLPLADTLDAAAQPQELPIFMAHGTFDPVLPLALGQAGSAALRNAGYTVDWHEYPMAHAVCAEEIADIRRWLLQIFDHQP